MKKHAQSKIFASYKCRLGVSVGRIFLAVFTTIVTQDFALAEVGIQGFQSWKQSRIEDAKTIIEKLQPERASGGSSSGSPSFNLQNNRSEKSLSGTSEKKSDSKDSKADPISVVNRHQANQRDRRADQKMQQAQQTLEVAQELTINDYFLIYLSQFKARDIYLEAAKKLTSEEVADLLMAYQKHLTQISPPTEDSIALSAVKTGVPSLQK